ncbi:hypothetical protein PF008_g4904 [Phytophthora fragariae]|uniref:DDE Tnp4 domain-containing protein n=1 Tax=Phytophthora fragariae TaxID=53985 RepID=A0A6G0SAI8_9STRA|nr:hypothetical protein PF008_g4904 [Phytophthora fragariae]
MLSSKSESAASSHDSKSSKTGKGAASSQDSKISNSSKTSGQDSKSSNTSETRGEMTTEDDALAGLVASLGCEQEDGSDMELCDAVVCVAAAAEMLAVHEDYFCRQRLIWSDHVQKLRREKQFARYYRMNEDAFDHLVAILQSDLRVDERMPTRRTGGAPISAEVVLHCTLRWLAGGSYLDIHDVGHISVPSFYRCLHKRISAILASADLSIDLPKSLNDIERAVAQFARCSTDNMFDGCVGCIDGVLVRIKTPVKVETGCVRSCFSGHYDTMGLNVQAVCDSKSRFIFFAVAAPGSSSDIRTLRQTFLFQFVDSLPTGRYLIGDCAYVPTEHMLTPFGGSRKAISAHDNYNFYLSQLRIKIEQAFGLMTTKWRRLRFPLQHKEKKAAPRKTAAPKKTTKGKGAKVKAKKTKKVPAKKTKKPSAREVAKQQEEAAVEKLALEKEVERQEMADAEARAVVVQKNVAERHAAEDSAKAKKKADRSSKKKKEDEARVSKTSEGAVF